jgi:hypothetical protein
LAIVSYFFDMMFARKSILLGICATLAVTVSGTAFLKATSKHEASRVSAQDVQMSLLAEIEGSLGTGIASKRVTDMKDILGPMFAALPKNAHGNLEHITVRYALHRVFIQRHGWSIKGLDHAGAGWSASSATGILKDQVPDFIQNLFEQRLGSRGLGLHELAVFAATIEHLVHNEAVGRLGSALSLHGLLPTGTMTSSQADEILDTYMMAYILGENLGNMTLEEANAVTQQMPEIFLAWNDTQSFVREVRQNLTSSGAAEDQDISFAMLVKIAETIGERFGKFQDSECKGLKSALVKMEDRSSGRVRLSDFYKPAANGDDGSWQFQESVGYLRQLGILDETRSDEPRVMIVNYLTSQANCIASSDYYSVCCIDECEDLFSHMEQSLAAPEATPARIAELVSALPSSSVSAPRELSATLRTRLDDIASSHGGSVQLHGRLFAQWMHHAYPRECPYPHISGTTSQENADTWTDANGDNSVATEEELMQFTAASNFSSTEMSQPLDDVHDLMMWSHEEELLIVRPTLPPTASPGFAGAKSGVLFAALASVVYGFMRTVMGPSSMDKELPQKFMV